MIVRIIRTTDGKFLGHEFDSSDNPIVLSKDELIFVDKILEIEGGLRFVSSNYVVDTEELNG